MTRCAKIIVELIAIFLLNVYKRFLSPFSHVFKRFLKFYLKLHDICEKIMRSGVRLQWKTHTEKYNKATESCVTVHGRTGPPGCLALARWAGWSSGQVGRNVKCWSRL